MIIKVEQELLLRVLEHPNHRQGLSPHPSGPVDECLVDKTPLRAGGCTSTWSFDDCDTLSTTSLSDSDSDSEPEKTVSFADSLVTEEWTRPYTPKEEVETLFYTNAETAK